MKYTLPKYLFSTALICTASLLTACGDDDAPVNEAVKGSINLIGTARVNQVLSIEADFSDRNGIEGISSSYQWYGDGLVIEDETSATLVLGVEQRGQEVHAVMDFLDDDGFSETLTSDSVNIYDAYKLSMVTDSEDTIIITSTDDLPKVSNVDDVIENWTTPVEPVVTDTINEKHSFPSIASDEKGNLVAVAISKDNITYGADGDVVYTRSTDNGLTWSAIDLLLPADADIDKTPIVETDKNGNWVVVWSSDRSTGDTGSDFDIFFVTSRNNGEEWEGPHALNEWAASDTHDDVTPQISINNSKWVVAWSSMHDPDNGRSDNPDNDSEVFSSFSVDGGVEWSGPKRISKGGVDNNTEDTMPKMHINSVGAGLIIWTAEDANRGDSDIYASRTFDFGETWIAGVILNDDTAEDDSFTDNEEAASVYTLTNGTYVAAWHGYVDGDATNKGAYYVYSSTYGGTWSATRTLKDDSSIDEVSPQLIGKPNGGWIASWMEEASGKVFVSESTNLESWSTTPLQMTNTASSAVDWVIH